ncbi:unnamed protein product [Arabidopsis lyrata]|nr:unnamed protein product [Arabidopsis lyrata]
MHIILSVRSLSIFTVTWLLAVFLPPPNPLLNVTSSQLLSTFRFLSFGRLRIRGRSMMRKRGDSKSHFHGLKSNWSDSISWYHV